MPRSLSLGEYRFMKYAGVLFDMDGTLVDSDAVVARVWTEWSERNAVDPAEVLRITPGRPARDSLRDLAPWLTEAERDAEAEALLAIERADLDGVVATEGALALLDWLTAAGLPFGIVTSADRPLAVARLGAAGITAPDVLVTASETVRGKPDPEGYLTAAARLRLDPRETLVVEDSLAGVLAGKAAGATVAGLRGVPGATLDISTLSALHELLR
jgi:sugar-phosphatase